MAKPKDLSGQRFGILTALRYIPGERKQNSKRTHGKWLCKCDCGSEIQVIVWSLKSQNTQSCGCMGKPAARIDMTAQKFGKLTAVHLLRKKNRIYWKCKCDCGNNTTVASASLRNGNTTSCGCLQKYTSFSDAIDQNTQWNGECLEWTGSIRGGYGRFTQKMKSISAHRAAYIAYHGEIQDGLVVRHLCHNRRCVRKEHLAVGTYKDNTEDSVKAGRIAHKLKPCHVLEIRELYRSNPKRTRWNKEGISIQELAIQFGMSESAIADIIKRKTWKHLRSNDV